MDYSNNIDGPSRRQSPSTDPSQSPPALSPPAQYEEGYINSDDAPYQHNHGYSYEPTSDTDGSAGDHPLQSPKYDERTDDSQIALPALESLYLSDMYYSDDYSDEASTPPSMADEADITIPNETEHVLPMQPQIYFPLANEPPRYASDGTEVPPTSLPMNYPAVVPPDAFHQTYAQTSTLWRRLELSVQVLLYSNETRLEVFERMIEAEIDRRLEERIAAAQRAHLYQGRGATAILNGARNYIERSNPLDRIKHEVDELQREMGIFGIITSSSLSSDPVVVRGNNSTLMDQRSRRR